MFHIEFVGMLLEGSPPEVLDRMTTDIADLPHVVTHAKSLYANVIIQRVHKPLPRGFRILDIQGTEVARWSVDDS
jgi:hypothetical protein